MCTGWCTVALVALPLTMRHISWHEHACSCRSCGQPYCIMCSTPKKGTTGGGAPIGAIAGVSCSFPRSYFWGGGALDSLRPFVATPSHLRFQGASSDGRRFAAGDSIWWLIVSSSLSAMLAMSLHSDAL